MSTPGKRRPPIAPGTDKKEISGSSIFAKINLSEEFAKVHPTDQLFIDLQTNRILTCSRKVLDTTYNKTENEH